MTLENQVTELLLAQGFSAPDKLTRLGGLTNFSFRAQSADYDLVVRFPGEGTEELVDRAGEKIINTEASRIGVDTPLHYFDAETGRKISGWVPNAETMHIETAAKPDNLSAMGRILAKLHAEANEVDVIFDPVEKVFEYERLIFAGGGTLWEDYEQIKQRVLEVVEKVGDAKRTMCHCDPLCENFVKDAETGRMYLLDWEYSGMCDPLWDVADVIVEAHYDEAQQLEFERAYFGRDPRPEEVERIIVNMVLIDFLWSLWGEQRALYDPALVGYGDERFARAKVNLEKLG